MSEKTAIFELTFENHSNPLTKIELLEVLTLEGIKPAEGEIVQQLSYAKQRDRLSTLAWDTACRDDITGSIPITLLMSRLRVTRRVEFKDKSANDTLKRRAGGNTKTVPHTGLDKLFPGATHPDLDDD